MRHLKVCKLFKIQFKLRLSIEIESKDSNENVDNRIGRENFKLTFWVLCIKVEKSVRTYIYLKILQYSSFTSRSRMNSQVHISNDIIVWNRNNEHSWEKQFLTFTMKDVQPWPSLVFHVKYSKMSFDLDHNSSD